MKNKIIGLILAALIGVGGYATKSYNVDEAVEVVSDTAKATEACVSLLQGQGFKTADPVDTGVSTVTTTTVVDDSGEAVTESSTTTPAE